MHAFKPAFPLRKRKKALQEGRTQEAYHGETCRSARAWAIQEGQKYTSQNMRLRLLKLKDRKLLNIKETKDLKFCSWIVILGEKKSKKWQLLEIVCWCTKDTDKRPRDGFSCHNAFYQSHHPAEVRAGKCSSPQRRDRKLTEEEEAALALIETMPKIACVVQGVLLSAHKKKL